MLHWKKKAQTLTVWNRDLEAKVVDDESTIRKWINHCDKLSTRVNDLTLENNRLTKIIENMTEEEELEEEMVEILEMINSSTNTDFEYLIDAVRFLLEVARALVPPPVPLPVSFLVPFIRPGLPALIDLRHDLAFLDATGLSCDCFLELYTVAVH